MGTSDEACVAQESRVSCQLGVCSQTNDGPLLTDSSEKEEPVPSALPSRLKIGRLLSPFFFSFVLNCSLHAMLTIKNAYRSV